MSLLSQPGVTPIRPIGLHTKANNFIDNDQPLALSAFVKNQAKDFEQKYQKLKRRQVTDPSYNCHGLVFASRRTWILKPQAVLQILAEDQYREVDRADVLPGDIMIYFLDEEPEHSAIVLEPPTEYKDALVFGKWGAWDEVIHIANVGPYATLHKKFYRMP